LYEPKDVANRWKEYVQELFWDTRNEDVEKTTEGINTGTPILRSKVESAITQMKTGKCSRTR